jgi:hypothetical protein
VSKRLLALSIGLTAMVAAALAAQEPTELIARRLPFGAPVVAVPLTPSSLQRALAEVAWAARIPIGYEAPEDELWQPAPPSRTMNVEGQTVEQVLNAIVALQPHYGLERGRWRDPPTPEESCSRSQQCPESSD